jgi:hypothetical protein
LGPASPAITNSFARDLSIGLQTAHRSIAGKTQRAKERSFDCWSTFCADISCSNTLNSVDNQEAKHLFLIVYCVRYRATGTRDKPVQATTTLDEIDTICSEIIKLGGSDPRRPKHSPNVSPPAQCPSWTEHREGLKKEDGPSSCVHLVNITIIRALVEVLNRDDPKFGLRWAHIIDLAIVAFYWLLRPCKYLFNNMDPDDGNTVSYELRHFQLTIAGCTYSALAAPLHDSTGIDSITAASLQLDDQKNGKKGEVIDHAATADPLLCPAKVLGRIALRHIQWHRANPDPDTHPGSQKQYEHVGPSRNWYNVSNRHVTTALRDAAAHVYDKTGIPPALISARSMHPGGATALLCAGVDADAIKLVEHWKSDSMLLYLQAQVKSNQISKITLF